MLKAFIFDLDGTLVKTERLKALSYEKAARDLRPDLQEGAILEAFKDVVGRPRREVAQALLARFDLEGPAAARTAEFGVSTPWQAYVQLRLRHYEEMLANPQVLTANRWPHTNLLLERARAMNCTVALATMSRCEQAYKVLELLGYGDTFAFVATRDDVEHGKPDPEIYQLVANELGLEARTCLVVEDSLSGVQAALAAGMHVVAVATPFTQETLHQSGAIPASHIVDAPEELPAVVAHVASHI